MDQSFNISSNITETTIATIVDAFYTKVRADKRLGPIFEHNISAPWPEHLEQMRKFWSSIILKTGVYKGQPMPAHMRLDSVRPADFAIWLRLFRETVHEHCSAEVATCIIARAERIAESLQLAMFFRDGMLLPGTFKNGVWEEHTVEAGVEG